MKIKKVDDKPMVIHTKQKAKIHSHEPKQASIKGSNVYTVNRGPKIVKTEISDKKSANQSDMKKKLYRKSTVHDVNVKEKGLARFKRNMQESGKSIKVKDTSLKIRGATAAGTKAVTDQVEGGQEMQQAAMIAYGATKPVVNASERGAQLMKQQYIQRKAKIKKVNAAKKIGKKTVKETAKKAAKETTKAAAKESAKIATKTATTVAATTAGTAVAPGVGTAIGWATGEVVGAKIEHDDMVRDNRMRKIKFFLDKMKAEGEQTDSVAKLAKDLIFRRVSMVVSQIISFLAPILLIVVLLVAMVAIPVMAVIAVLYNSPFALFLPPLEDGDTVTTVASAYVSEFNRDVNDQVTNHTGYDLGEIVYVDYEGTDANPTNYYDILGVYMVKYGVGDTATIMNDTSKGWLQTVVNDMCSYTTSTGSKSVEVTDADGNVTTETKTVLYVNVSLKNYHDMATQYGFNAEQIQLLSEVMSSEYMTALGYGGGAGGGGSGVSELSAAEITAILTDITGNQRTVCEYALNRVGYPYSQAYRDSGNYYDCSSLAYYSWQAAGVNIAYGGATTAAAEAQGLDEAGKTVEYADMQPGDLIFYSYNSNGRYKNISHVAIYVGNGKAVEALNESLGVVYRDVSTGSIVLIGRPN